MKYCFFILLYLSIYIHSKKINLLDTVQDISKTGKTNANHLRKIQTFSPEIAYGRKNSPHGKPRKTRPF